MIPNRLRLCNFMCYRQEQSLDFSGIHLVCLAGDNGHGKSALLDAMTWALWGKARARRDDELIALGESEMWVDLEFELGGQRYRVWRQRSKKGSGQSDLHYYVWSPSSGNWQLLDEGGLRERQAQIIRSLRMEYETFTNSAFLLQGKADSFTVRTPSERKQILGDILGLGQYDIYEVRAKEEAQARKEQAVRIEGALAAIDAELARRSEYEARLQATQATAATAVGLLRHAEAEQARGRLAVQERQAQARQKADLENRLARQERDLEESSQQLSAVQARLAQLGALLVQKAEIEAGWANLQAARAEDAGWNARLLGHTQVSDRLNGVRLMISQGRLALEADRRRLTDQQEELGRKVVAGVQQADILAQVQQILEGMRQKDARREMIVAELRQLAEDSARARSENDRLKSEGQAIKEKMALLSETEAATCPLCGQPLAPDHRDRMLAEMQVERSALADRFQANLGEVKRLGQGMAALEAEDAALARELKSKDARQRQAAQAETILAESEAAAKEQERIAHQVAELDTRLSRGDYALAERAELADIEAELAATGYDGASHEKTRVKVRELEPFDARYNRQLLPALDSAPEARSRAESLARQCAQREAALVEDRAERDRLTLALADLPEAEAELARANAEVEKAAQAERRARQEEGAAMQQLEALAVLVEKREERVAEREAVNAEISIYTQLREAFGKKGVQAMIIETAIPEVEIEANLLLSRMSEGRMSLRLETQREKVTGGIAETLDIVISDELGARAYEMYSGGEAFRANLALRIAISKLLTRRSGAQLQTLVIDEGFGTQDTQGRTLLVEAINSIKEDFERVIVITHIEELRDLFPARIDVVKTASGSRVTVS